MSRNPKAPKHDSPLEQMLSRIANGFAGRDRLGAYITDPASFPPARVISYNEQLVVINDMFPKSSVHLLLLPRDVTKLYLHPFSALSDPEFLAAVKSEVNKLRSIVASELRRRYARFSQTEKIRNEAMDAKPPLLAEKLP